ncbi:hypothetical protein AB1Y20_012261 [Prymnesium parvum]|uniref:Uncharacterized protein n=1 Tax=Prymnesium parvum TaxID=97485 RepID=A0AB34IQD7_PRYPA
MWQPLCAEKRALVRTRACSATSSSLGSAVGGGGAGGGGGEEAASPAEEEALHSDSDEGLTEAQLEQKERLAALSERARGYLERMRQTDFGYQQMSAPRRPPPVRRRDEEGEGDFDALLKARSGESGRATRLPPRARRREQLSFVLSSDRWVARVESDTPGPGTYAAPRREAFSSSSLGAAHMRPRRPSGKKELTWVGPGTYYPVPTCMTISPQFTIATKSQYDASHAAAQPFPLDARDSSVNPIGHRDTSPGMPGHRGYSVPRARRDFDDMSPAIKRTTLGPGAHSPQKADLTSRSATFKGRRSLGHPELYASTPPSVGPGCFLVPERPPITGPAGQSSPSVKFAVRPFIRPQISLATSHSAMLRGGLDEWEEASRSPQDSERVEELRRVRSSGALRRRSMIDCIKQHATERGGAERHQRIIQQYSRRLEAWRHVLCLGACTMTLAKVLFETRDRARQLRAVWTIARYWRDSYKRRKLAKPKWVPPDAATLARAEASIRSQLKTRRVVVKERAAARVLQGFLSDLSKYSRLYIAIHVCMYQLRQVQWRYKSRLVFKTALIAHLERLWALLEPERIRHVIAAMTSPALTSPPELPDTMLSTRRLSVSASTPTLTKQRSRPYFPPMRKGSLKMQMRLTPEERRAEIEQLLRRREAARVQQMREDALAEMAGDPDIFKPLDRQAISQELLAQLGRSMSRADLGRSSSRATEVGRSGSRVSELAKSASRAAVSEGSEKPKSGYWEQYSMTPSRDELIAAIDQALKTKMK